MHGLSALDIHKDATEIPLADNFMWPGGKRIAVFFRVSFEWWSDQAWPGIGPMGNPIKNGVPDLNAVGWAEYGHRRGIQRILAVLARNDVKASVNVSGIMAERYPETVARIAAEGHEVVAHSYSMDVIPIYLSKQEELDNIERTTELIEKATGVKPKGWISPRSTPSLRSPRLLAECGFEWHGDTLNDDMPYLVKFDNGSIVAFPNSTEVNDLPLYMRHGNSPRILSGDFFSDWLEKPPLSERSRRASKNKDPADPCPCIWRQTRSIDVTSV